MIRKVIMNGDSEIATLPTVIEIHIATGESATSAPITAI